MSDYGIFWGKDVLKVAPHKREPIIEHLLWEGDTVFIIGREKVGKSIFALQMACSLTSGEDFLDTFKIKREHHIVYVQTEGKRYETQERLDNMIYGIRCDLNNFTHIFLPNIALDTTQGIDDLENMLSDNGRKPDVVFIDPLYMSMMGDMKDAKAARAWIGNVRKLVGKYNAALVITHHAHRQKRAKDGSIINDGDEAVYGSFIWKAFADHMFMMNRGDKVYTLSCDTQRSAKVVNKISFVLHHPRPLLFTIEDQEANTKSIMVYKYIQIEKSIDADSLMHKLNLPRATLYRALRRLLTTKMIVKGHSRPVVYTLPKDPI